MRISYLTPLFFAGYTVAHASHGAHSSAPAVDMWGPSSVVQLGSTNFTDLVSTAQTSIVEFYAEWCPHCQALKSEYDQLAAQVNPDVVVGRVDCEQNKDLCTKEGASGYPHLNVYRSGVAQEYTGETSTEKMLEFIASFDAPLKVLKKTSHASDFLMRYTTSIVGAFEPNTPAHTAFGLAAQKFNKGIARVESKKMARRLEIKMDSVVAFSLDDKPPRVFNGPFNTAAIQDFIVAVRDVTVQELDEKVYKMVASQGLPLAMLFYSSDDEKTLYGEMLETAAKAYRKEALYFRVDANKYATAAESLGLPLVWPAFAIMHGSRKYHMPQGSNLTPETIGRFLKAFVLKELEPIIKSEEEGEQSNETVKKIVGSTIVSTVEQSHLFLMVYSPSCPHCDKLKPVWANLGSEFANIDVTIGKLDNTLNDIPVSLELEVTGVPTLAFFKRGSIKAVVHEGPRSISGLRTFLKKQLADVADETQEL